MYKKAGCTCKVVVLLIKPIVFWFFLTFSLPSASLDLKVPISELTKQDGTKKRTAKRLCDKRDRTITCVFVAKFNKYNCVLIFTKRSFKRKVKFGGNCFQTELLSRLSHKVFRLLPSTVPLRKFTINNISNSIINLPY